MSRTSVYWPYPLSFFWHIVHVFGVRHPFVCFLIMSKGSYYSLLYHPIVTSCVKRSSSCNEIQFLCCTCLHVLLFLSHQTLFSDYFLSYLLTSYNNTPTRSRPISNKFLIKDSKNSVTKPTVFMLVHNKKPLKFYTRTRN